MGFDTALSVEWERQPGTRFPVHVHLRALRLRTVCVCVWIDLYYSYGPYTRRQDYSQGAIEIYAKGHRY
eukprot:COSAG01_NODE_3126_length_6545_cov_7.559572_1_plen_68_part_10